jgi:hypothetical protein
VAYLIGRSNRGGGGPCPPPTGEHTLTRVRSLGDAIRAKPLEWVDVVKIGSLPLASPRMVRYPRRDLNSDS